MSDTDLTREEQATNGVSYRLPERPVPGMDLLTLLQQRHGQIGNG